MSNHDTTRPDSLPSTVPTSPPHLRIVPTPTPVPTGRGPRKPKPKNPHRGVQIIPPTPDHGHHHWRLRWTDPDDRRPRHRNLTPAEAKNAETRRDAAIGLRKDLDARKRQLDLGATPFESGSVPIVETFRKYFESGRHARKRPSTRESYEVGAMLFLAWCKLHRYTLTRQIVRRMLAEYADSRAKVVLQGSTTGELRAAPTVNKEIKWLRAILRDLRTADLISISSDDIAAALKPLPEDVKPGAVYLIPELLADLGGCHRHDVATRGQMHTFAGRSLPVTLLFLLTGLRPKEALEVEWSDVLTAPGRVQLRVGSHVAKTRRERIIDTAHSPLLAWLLGNHAGRSGRILDATKDTLQDLRTTLRVTYDTRFTWKKTRRTCGSYLTCAPNIFGAGAVYLSAMQLGHTVATAQKSYLNVVQVSPDARTTEAAMGIVTQFSGDTAHVTVTVDGVRVEVALARL